MDQEDLTKLPLLIYDEECVLCSRFKQALERVIPFDQLFYSPLQNENIYLIYPLLNRDNCEADVHLIKSDGSILVGSEVVEYLVTLSPAVKKFAWLMESEMGQKALDFFYERASNARETLLKRCPKCKNKASRCKDKQRRPEA